MNQPTVLAFDTRGAFCDACLMSQGVVVHRITEQMTKGQAERLMPLLQDLLDACDLTYDDLDRIGVGVGPGNFTGVRIAVSAARGLAMGLGIPAIGVSALEAQSFRTQTAHYSVLTATQNADAHRVYWQKMDGTAQPHHFGLIGDVPRDLPSLGPIANTVANSLVPQMAEVHAIAHIAATADGPFDAPKPLYIKPADAAPPREQPPVILP